MQYKAILFDLDGTLLDTLETLSYYGNSTLEAFGIMPYPKEDYKYMVGTGAKNLIRKMLAGRGGKTEEMFEKAYAHYIKIYNNDKLFKTEIYPGICDLLKELREKGIKLAVLSNKPDEATVPIVKSFFGENTFEIIRGAMEGVPLKPDPAAALDIAEKLGVIPEECLYAGDTAVDMETGKNSGFYTIGVLWGFRDEKELTESGADFIAKVPQDILSVL